MRQNETNETIGMQKKKSRSQPPVEMTKSFKRSGKEGWITCSWWPLTRFYKKAESLETYLAASGPAEHRQGAREKECGDGAGGRSEPRAHMHYHWHSAVSGTTLHESHVSGHM